jgi:hypothetical protein
MSLLLANKSNKNRTTHQKSMTAAGGWLCSLAFANDDVMTEDRSLAHCHAHSRLGNTMFFFFTRLE